MRREQLTEAAVKVFAERGFNGTTTKDIARAAGVSEGILFKYFKTKSELYATIFEFEAEQIYEKGWIDQVNEHAAQGNDEKVFRAVAVKITEYCRRDPNFLRLMLYTALEEHENARPFRRRLIYPIFELLRNYIGKRIAEGFFQPCSSEAAAFAFIGSLIYYAMSSVLLQSKMLSVREDEVRADFIKLTVDGLRCHSPKNDFSA